MVYAAKNLTRHAGIPYIAGDTKGVWGYGSADALAAIAASGYFNNATNRLRKGDIIHVLASLGGTVESGQLQVTSATGAATVTTRAIGGSSGLVSLTAGATLTQAAHANRLLALNAAAGQAIILPAASGSGDKYEFVVGTTITSNTSTIKVANATDIMAGNSWQTQDSADTVVAFETAADSDTITLDGSTRGGLRGDRVKLRDIAAGVWQVEVMAKSTGTEATPFSASVS